MTLEAMVYGLPVPPADLDASLVAWRCRQLIGVGFDEPLANEFAKMHNLDLHALLELVEQGCSPRLAARLLEPVGGAWT